MKRISLIAGSLFVVAVVAATVYPIALPNRSGGALNDALIEEALAAQVDYFLKIDGVPGESKADGHEDEIDIESWSWGLERRPLGTAVGGSTGAGRVNIHDLSFTMETNKATPVLMLHCADGKHIEKAVLTVRKAGERPIEYLKITMTDVLVTSVSTGGSGGEDRTSEHVTLNFSKVKVEYTEQAADGSPILPPIEAVITSGRGRL